MFASCLGKGGGHKGKENETKKDVDKVIDEEREEREDID